MGLPQSHFPAAIDEHLSSVYHLAYRMTLDKAQAAEAAYETFLRAWHGKREIAPGTLGSWLLKIASHVVESRLPGAPEVSFDLLDETLRSEATRTGEVRSLSNPEREYLLWELKQGCMTSVVNCISPGERVAFVLGAILGTPDEEAAAILGIKPSAYKVRLSRARKKISDYLQPRCEHVDPRNPCHCPSRIGVALQRGFIAPPAQPVVQLRTFERAERGRDPSEIYRTLPVPEVPAELRERIRAAAASGDWPPVQPPPADRPPQ
jgi:RNA polymerase sigma factor (sigma-70 family)